MKIDYSKPSPPLDHQVKLMIEAASVSDRDLVFEYLKQIVPEYKTVGDRHGSTADD